VGENLVICVCTWQAPDPPDYLQLVSHTNRGGQGFPVIRVPRVAVNGARVPDGTQEKQCSFAMLLLCYESIMVGDKRLALARKWL
jgi:hypothetical protein